MDFVLPYLHCVIYHIKLLLFVFFFISQVLFGIISVFRIFLGFDLTLNKYTKKQASSTKAESSVTVPS